MNLTFGGNKDYLPHNMLTLQSENLVLSGFIDVGICVY